jgi:lipoyl(octanoyl) transferase
MMSVENHVVIRWLNQQPYLATWQAMQDFTNRRDESTPDEIWLLEHEPVFTQGQNGKPEHILNPGDIPIVQTDRGGQVTYHGPGQLMIYTLLDLKRKQWTIRGLVSTLEQTIIDFIESQTTIKACANPKAPGVYVPVGPELRKICSIGLRIRRGYSYHGMAFNIQLNLEPFARINPCGFSTLKMIQLAELIPVDDLSTCARQLSAHLINHLSYTTANYVLESAENNT